MVAPRKIQQIVLACALAAGVAACSSSGASMNPARTLGPDIVAVDFSGWWVHVAGDAIGAVIAVCLIGLVRGLPDRAEIDAAKGDALSG